MQSNNQVAKITKELIKELDPASWGFWLLDIQSSLIANGSTAGLSEEGADELSGRFAYLKNFFQDLHDLQKK